LHFITIRKFANFEWETYHDKKDGKFLAICHQNSLSVQSDSWNGIWDEILRASKEYIKKNKRRKVDRYG